MNINTTAEVTEETTTASHDWWIRQFRLDNMKDSDGKFVDGKFQIHNKDTDEVIATDIEDWDNATTRSRRVNEAFNAFSRKN